jgi:hypothetical protein
MIGDKWLPEVWEPVKAGEYGGYVFEGCESIGELSYRSSQMPESSQIVTILYF